MPKIAKARKTQQWIQNALEDAKTQFAILFPERFVQQL